MHKRVYLRRARLLYLFMPDDPRIWLLILLAYSGLTYDSISNSPLE